MAYNLPDRVIKEITAFAKENIHSLLSFDVVDMNSRVTEELKKEIERDGVVIYEKTR